MLRADIRRRLQDYEGAIGDFQKCADIYYQERNMEYYQPILEAIAQLECL